MSSLFTASLTPPFESLSCSQNHFCGSPEQSQSLGIKNSELIVTPKARLGPKTILFSSKHGHTSEEFRSFLGIAAKNS
jgi:hypothetical protein